MVSSVKQELFSTGEGSERVTLAVTTKPPVEIEIQTSYRPFSLSRAIGLYEVLGVVIREFSLHGLPIKDWSDEEIASMESLSSNAD